jgi:hypothetical protein
MNNLNPGFPSENRKLKTVFNGPWPLTPESGGFLMPCKICNYNQVQDLDRLLLAGATPAFVNQRYPSFTTAELQRHREHLEQKMTLARRRFQVKLHLGLFCKLNTVLEMTLGVVHGAGNGGDFKLFLQAGRESTRIINLMHKMAAKLEIDPEFLYCLMASPQWDVQEKALLPDAFQALADTRHTLKVNLFAPCPEPEPQVPEPALNSKVTVLHPDQENSLHHQALDRLSRTPSHSPREPGQGTATGESTPENLRATCGT